MSKFEVGDYVVRTGGDNEYMYIKDGDIYKVDDEDGYNRLYSQGDYIGADLYYEKLEDVIDGWAQAEHIKTGIITDVQWVRDSFDDSSDLKLQTKKGGKYFKPESFRLILEEEEKSYSGFVSFEFEEIKEKVNSLRVLKNLIPTEEKSAREAGFYVYEEKDWEKEAGKWQEAAKYWKERYLERDSYSEELEEKLEEIEEVIND